MSKRQPFAAALAAVLLSSYSLPGAASVLIGNPKLTVHVATANGLVFNQVKAAQAVPRADACDPIALDGGQPAQLLGRTVPLPALVCALGLEVGGTLTIQGQGVAGGTFSLVLSVSDLVDMLAQPETLWIDGGPRAYHLELASADWVTAADLGLVQGQHVVVDDNHPLHDDLVAAIELDSLLLRDSDGDGVIDGSERAAGGLW